MAPSHGAAVMSPTIVVLAGSCTRRTNCTASEPGEYVRVIAERPMSAPEIEVMVATS
ncbi:hypothetical protein MRBLWO12_003026 [Microbacterium sp. LWO12-1.2]